MTKRVLLENFLDDRLISKLRKDATITMDKLVIEDDVLINKLRSYYSDDYPDKNTAHQTNHAQVLEKINSPTIEKTDPIKTRYVTIAADWVTSEKSAEQ